MAKETYIINCEQTLKTLLQIIPKIWLKYKYITVVVSNDQQRTKKQNDALHLYLRLLAQALNDSGQGYVFKFNGRDTQCEWTMETVKERLWHPMQIAITDKKSSKDLTIDELIRVHKNFELAIIERCEGLRVPFPDKEDLEHEYKEQSRKNH